MAKGNLLIIDDEELLLKNIKYLLQGYADKTFLASNGLEGLKVLEKEDIHCVICDISMPQMNGVELIRVIREKGSEVPFIFYTAYGHSELMIEAAKYGAFDFLKKPDFEGLEEVVSRGIKEGFKRKNFADMKEEMMTEYEKILITIKNDL
ncbi:MAG: response regulator [Bacteriovoracia bacterium]